MRTTTGSALPVVRSRRRTVKPSRRGQARGRGRAGRTRRTGRRSQGRPGRRRRRSRREAVRPQALLDERGDAVLVLGDEDAVHRGPLRRDDHGEGGAAGRGADELDPAAVGRRRWRGRWPGRARTLGAAAGARRGRSARRCGPGPRRRCPGRCRAPTSAARRAEGGRRRPSAVPAGVCLTALSASWSSAWVSRCAVGAHHALGAGVEQPAAGSQWPHLVHDVVGEPADVDGRRMEEVGPPRLGEQDQVLDQARHPVQLVEQQGAGLGTSAGSSGSSSSR